MKEYDYEIKLHIVGCGIEALNKKEAREIIKESFATEGGYDLNDTELTITERKVVK